jgi:DNA-binding MarR family transcriptional regulator
MAARTTPKRELAADVWQPLARFFFDTVRHRQRVLGAEGLTPNDARALMALDRSKGRTMRNLADEWLCDASNATFIIDRLEERALVERRSVPTDRRVKLVVLTPLGERTRGHVLHQFFEPPPELLELPREDLEALRAAVVKLPVSTNWSDTDRAG